MQVFVGQQGFVGTERKKMLQIVDLTDVLPKNKTKLLLFVRLFDVLLQGKRCAAAVCCYKVKRYGPAVVYCYKVKGYGHAVVCCPNTRSIAASVVYAQFKSGGDLIFWSKDVLLSFDVLLIDESMFCCCLVCTTK